MVTTVLSDLIWQSGGPEIWVARRADRTFYRIVHSYDTYNLRHEPEGVRGEYTWLGQFLSLVAAQLRAADHNFQYRRREAWETYMKHNDPPDWKFE